MNQPLTELLRFSKLLIASGMSYEPTSNKKMIVDGQLFFRLQDVANLIEANLDTPGMTFEELVRENDRLNKALEELKKPVKAMKFYGQKWIGDNPKYVAITVEDRNSILLAVHNADQIVKDRT